MVLLLHSGRCYKAEICVILFLLRCPFIWYPFRPKSVFGQKPWTIIRQFEQNRGHYLWSFYSKLRCPFQWYQCVVSQISFCLQSMHYSPSLPPFSPLQVVLLPGAERLVIAVAQVHTAHGDRGDVVTGKGSGPRTGWLQLPHPDVDPAGLPLSDEVDATSRHVCLGLHLHGRVLSLVVKLHHLYPQL